MRRCVYAVLLWAAFGFGARAAPCLTGSLAAYISLGPSGCSIGQNTYSGFQSLPISAGSTQINPSAVTVTPSGGSFNPELTFSVSLTEGAGSASETLLNYSVTGTIYLNDIVTLSNASETVDGGVSDTVNFCENGRFGSNGVTGCAGTTGGTALVDGVLNRDTLTFNSPSFVSLTDDLLISGGTAGQASGATITDQLASVPEPASYLLTAFGVAVALVLKSRLLRRG